jgi:hypothetical protein
MRSLIWLALLAAHEHAQARAQSARDATVAGLLRALPDDTTAMMALDLASKDAIVPFDKLLAPLESALPVDAIALAGNIRPYSMGALAIAAGKKDFAPVALARQDPDAFTQTVLLAAPTAARAAAAKETRGGLKFAPAEVGWSTLIVDEHTVALVAAAQADRVARAIAAHHVGHPRALTRPLDPLGANVIALVRVLPTESLLTPPPDGLAEAALTIRSEHGGVALDVALRAERGRSAAVAALGALLRRAGAAATGPLADAFHAARVTIDRDTARATYAFSRDALTALVFSH